MADIFFNSQVNMKITPVEPNNLVRLRDLEEHLEGVFTPTPEQQAAMDSGITAEKLAELEAKEFTPTPEQQDVLDSGITAEQLEEVTTTLDEVSGRNKPLQAVFDIVGDDTTVEYVFEHNWSTTNVTHEFYDKTTGSSVGAEFSRTDVNSVKVTFGLPLGVGNDLVLVLTASVDGSSNIPNGAYEEPLMDALPTLGSDKLVSSGGIATALVNQKTEIMNELEISEHFTAPTEKVQVLGNSSGAVNIDCSLGNLVTCTATGNITFAFTANTPAGQSRVLTIILTNGGAYTVTWPTSVDWPDATAPTLAATGISILSFITVDNGATWYGMLSR